MGRNRNGRRSKSGRSSREKARNRSYSRGSIEDNGRRKRRSLSPRSIASPTSFRKKIHSSPSVDSQSRFSSSSSSGSSSSSSHSSSGSSEVSPETRKRRKTPHFQFRVGEMLGYKYKVRGVLGTGTFGRVLEGQYHGRPFAIKVIKPVAKYITSAKTERNILKKICSRDPDDSYHIVRYVESFHHFSHFCLVFEKLGLSLYELIKKNSFKGFKPRHVRSFARQLFEGIGFMHANGYVHTDLKPQNILLCSDQLCQQQRNGKPYSTPKSKKIKLIDFGGATHIDQSHSSIINTRQYRSPQVILQCCEWNEPSDVWSIGCILAELYTGELLFHVHSDIDHLYMMEKISGKMPKWMAKHCTNDLKRLYHRDGSINYRYGDKRVNNFDQVMRLQSLEDILLGEKQLISLVRNCLQLDPRKRITCDEALRHRYFEDNEK